MIIDLIESIMGRKNRRGRDRQRRREAETEADALPIRKKPRKSSTNSVQDVARTIFGGTYYNLRKDANVTSDSERAT